MEPGSAEMPSAGHAFTPDLITTLVAKGVYLAPQLLHTGVSSLETGEPPYEEFYRLPASTARHVNPARQERGRVVAVGTTVVRAPESAADKQGMINPAEGWGGLVLTPDRDILALDSLLTGFHEPASSHLDILLALTGREHLSQAY